MSVALPRSNVPAEHRGRARQLRDAIAAEDRPAGAVISELASRIQAGIKRGRAIPRPETLAGVARDWHRDMPPRARLALDIRHDPRGKTLKIFEMRATSSSFRPDSWDTNEIGLIVDMIGLEVGPFHYQFKILVLAHVSLHALARRFQRGSDASPDAVLHDLKLLGQAHHRLADHDDGYEFSVPASGGAWIGTTEMLNDATAGPDKSLLVRTFLTDGA